MNDAIWISWSAHTGLCAGAIETPRDWVFGADLVLKIDQHGVHIVKARHCMQDRESVLQWLWATPRTEVPTNVVALLSRLLTLLPVVSP